MKLLVCLLVIAALAVTSEARVSQQLKRMFASEPEYNAKLTCWSKLRDAYPQGSSPDVRKRIGGGLDNDDWVNTCAIRMSNNFNEAGMKVQRYRLSQKYPWASRRGQMAFQLKSAKGELHFLRVMELAEYINHYFGKPNLVIRTKAKRGEDATETLDLKKANCAGIVRWNCPVWDDATGHFDLWDGKFMVEQGHRGEAKNLRYSKLCDRMELWCAKPCPGDETNNNEETETNNNNEEAETNNNNEETETNNNNEEAETNNNNEEAETNNNNEEAETNGGNSESTVEPTEDREETTPEREPPKPQSAWRRFWGRVGNFFRRN